MAAGTAGYAGTPLVRKLGIRPEHSVLLVDAPAAWVLPDLPDGVLVRRVRQPPRSGTPDVVLLFVRERAALAAVGTIGSMVFPAGSVWVVWPRKAGGHVSDVTENAIRDEALPLGLVDVKVAALDNDWSGLRLVWRKELRTASHPPAPPG